MKTRTPGYVLRIPHEPGLRMETFRSIAINQFGLVNAAYSLEAYDQTPELVPFWYYQTEKTELFPAWLANAILSRL